MPNINKVVYGNNTLIDLTGTTATADKIMEGYGAFGRDGAWMNGTAVPQLIGNVYQDANGYVVLDNGNSSQIIVDPLTVNLNGTYTAPTGHAYSPVTVNVDSGTTKKNVFFYDYDGTLLYSYTKQEFNNLTELPANPSHNGLISRGWNWNLSDAKDELVYTDKLNIGQTYTTSSGATEIDVTFVDSANLSPYLTLGVRGTVYVDWGDNSIIDTITGTNQNAYIYTQHVYPSVGSYTIKITTETSTHFLFYNNSNSYAGILRVTAGTSSANTYSSLITAVRLSENHSSCLSTNNSFSYCSSLKYVICSRRNFSNNIMTSLFGNNYALKCIIVPDGITKYGFAGSAQTTYLPKTIISLPHSINALNNYAFGGFPSDSIVMLHTITTLGTNSFFSSGITELSIPSGVTRIPDSCFSVCRQLEYLYIPSTVTSIAASAFSSCYVMKEYHFYSTTPPTLANINAFSNIPKSFDCKIYVPSASLSNYQTANNWSTYASYMVGE